MTSPWKKLYNAKRKKLSLESFDMEEFYIEIIPIVSYPQRVFNQAVEDDPEGGNAMFKLCIRDWNLTDPETDELLPLPKDDTDSIEKLPTLIVAWLADEIRKFSEASLPPSMTMPPTTSS